MNIPYSNTVYISNLSYKTDRNGLKSMFLPFGTVKNIKILVEPTTNQSRGMAFVEMGSIAEARKAIEGLDGQVYGGRTIKAKAAAPMQNFLAKTAADKKKKDENRDLRFEEIQLEKKARREARRASNPVVLKYVPAKKS